MDVSGAGFDSTEQMDHDQTEIKRPRSKSGFSCPNFSNTSNKKIVSSNDDSSITLMRVLCDAYFLAVRLLIFIIKVTHPLLKCITQGWAVLETDHVQVSLHAVVDRLIQNQRCA